jgi:hypothetical protein
VAEFAREFEQHHGDDDISVRNGKLLRSVPRGETWRRTQGSRTYLAGTAAHEVRF